MNTPFLLNGKLGESRIDESVKKAKLSLFNRFSVYSGEIVGFSSYDPVTFS